jgi:hypothetical protein
LHYAATLADNGHYYNLLLHLGANPLVLDNVSTMIFDYDLYYYCNFGIMESQVEFCARLNNRIF